MWLETKCFSILLNFLLLIVNTKSFYVSPSSHEFVVTEIVRVKRQAGYVYDKPSIPFDLPSMPSTVTTQAPNVDRTQAQQMYYAYPAPAKEQSSNANTDGAAASRGSASGGGYNYGAQNALGSQQVAQGDTSPQSVNLGAGQTSNANGGYSYNAPAGNGNQGQINAGSRSTSSSTATSSVSSSYFYDTPSSGSTTTSGKSKISSESAQLGKGNSGYNYNSVGTAANAQISNDLNNQNINDLSQGLSSTGYNYNNGGSVGKNTAEFEAVSISAKATLPDLSSYNYQVPTTGSFTNSQKDSLNSAAVTNTAGYGSGPVQVTSNSLNSITSQSTTGGDGNIQISAGNSGYNYNTPLMTDDIDSSQKVQSVSNSRATSSVSTNYGYEAPVQNQEISRESLRYLPPPSRSNKVTTAPAVNPQANGQINNQYVPPTGPSSSGNAGASSSQTYIPPSSATSQYNTPQGFSPSPNSISNNPLTQPSQSYIPPNNNPSITQNTQAYLPPSTAQSIVSNPVQQINTRSSASLVQPTNTYVPQQNTAQQATGVTSNQPTPFYLPTENRNSNSRTVNQSSSSAITLSGNNAAGANTNYLPPTLPTLPSLPNPNYLPPVTGTSLPAASYLPPRF